MCYWNEFVGSSEFTLIKKHGAPTQINEIPFHEINLVGSNKALIGKEASILKQGGIVRILRWVTPGWETTAFLNPADHICFASVRWDTKRVQL